jgi:hypothetical protein
MTTFGSIAAISETQPFVLNDAFPPWSGSRAEWKKPAQPFERMDPQGAAWP